MTIGANIKAARKQAQLTQKELGSKLGVSGTMIAMYETNQRKPKIQTLERIAIALNTSIVDLLDDVDDIHYFLQAVGNEHSEKDFISAISNLLHSAGFYVRPHETDSSKSILYCYTDGNKFVCNNSDLNELIESIEDYFDYKFDALLGKCERFIVK